MAADSKILLLSKHNVDANPKSSTSSTVEFPTSLRGKRILLATESLGPINGVSRTTGSLIEYLRSNNVEVAVVAPEIKPSRIKTSHACPRVDLSLSGWPLPYNPDLTIVYPFRLDRLFKKTFKPDLIYLASPASVGFQILLQSRQLLHSPPVICNFQTDLSGYGEIIFPTPMDAYAVWLVGVVQGFLFNALAVQTVFYPCSDIHRYLRSTGVSHNKLVHLGRGVDTAMFNPGRQDATYRNELAPNGEIILICVSRLAPEKGFDFLAKAAVKLASEAISFKLVIVGGNRNPSVQAEVRQYFNPIKDKVIFTGFLTGIDLARAYASADIFLHCSITETFGLVVLEAMASGIPVVARDQGGPSEIVLHEKTGFLTPPSDLDIFVNKVKSLCHDGDLRSDFARSSRQVALETTWEKINNKAAWYIASTIQRTEDAQLDHQRRQIQRKGNWIMRILLSVSGRGIAIVNSFRQRVRLLVAVMIVVGFWVVACIPLILHGTFMFKAE